VGQEGRTEQRTHIPLIYEKGGGGERTIGLRGRKASKTPRGGGGMRGQEPFFGGNLEKKKDNKRGCTKEGQFTCGKAFGGGGLQEELCTNRIHGHRGGKRGGIKYSSLGPTGEDERFGGEKGLAFQEGCFV